jgi:hypothetical protein
MESASRRNFLALAGGSAAGVGVTAAVGVLTGANGLAAVRGPSPIHKIPAAMTGSLVAYVADVQAGVISIMVGEDEVIVSDSALVARIAAAAAHSNTSPAL